MKLKAISELLGAEVLFASDQHLELEVRSAAASDLMSDILARARTPDLLLTGLANLQAVRTAAIASVKAVVIVRGKQATPQMIQLARDEDIPLLVTRHSLFAAAGQLWERGLKSGLDPA